MNFNHTRSGEIFVGSKESGSFFPEFNEEVSVYERFYICSTLTTTDNRFCGYFCSENIFNLSLLGLTYTERNLFLKGLDFFPFQHKINDLELKNGFNKFCMIMCIIYFSG